MKAGGLPPGLCSGTGRVALVLRRASDACPPITL